MPKNETVEEFFRHVDGARAFVESLKEPAAHPKKFQSLTLALLKRPLDTELGPWLTEEVRKVMKAATVVLCERRKQWKVVSKAGKDPRYLAKLDGIHLDNKGRLLSLSKNCFAFLFATEPLYVLWLEGVAHRDVVSHELFSTFAETVGLLLERIVHIQNLRSEKNQLEDPHSEM